MSSQTFETNDLDLLQQARHLWNARQFDSALDQFEAATKAHPENIRAQLERAKAMARRYQIEPAIEILDQATKLADGDQRVLCEIAAIYVIARRMDEAILAIEAIPADDRSAETWARLAVYYELTGRFEEASEAISTSAEMAKEQKEPRLIQARILIHRGKFEEAKEILGEILSDVPSNQPLFAIRGCYEMAVVNDRIGNYEQAMAFANRAKDVQKQAPGVEDMAKSYAVRTKVFSEVYKKIDQQVLDSWLTNELAPLSGNNKPVHLIGYPRSGTTLFEQVLDSHSKIAVASESLVFPDEIFPQLIKGEKGQSIFDHLTALPNEKLEFLRNEYVEMNERLHSEKIENKVLLDKKPANTTFLFGLLRLLPESKFIVAIRDPRDVITSCYMRYYPMSDMASSYLGLGTTVLSYAQVMEIWLYMRNILPKDRWIEVRYEDVVSDPMKQANRVFEFLGLENEDAVEDYLGNTKGKSVQSPTFAEVRKPVHEGRVGRWKNYAEFIDQWSNELKPFIDALGYE